MNYVGRKMRNIIYEPSLMEEFPFSSFWKKAPVRPFATNVYCLFPTRLSKSLTEENGRFVFGRRSFVRRPFWYNGKAKKMTKLMQRYKTFLEEV